MRSDEENRQISTHSISFHNTPPTSKKKTHLNTALLFRLKQRAMSSCSAYASAMAACAKDRTVSTVWACRSELNALNECLGKHTNERVLGELERRWVEAGRPEKPEWGALLEGL